MEKIFENTKVAFSLKSDLELKKARFMFKVIENPTLVKIGTWFTMAALRFRLPVKGLIKKTIFKQFCGGTNEKECIPIIEKLSEIGVTAILDYSVEAKEEEADFDAVMNKKITLIDFAKKNEGVSFAVMKPTALGRFKIWQKITEKKQLTSSEEAEWERIEKRFNRICSHAFQTGVPILIDAEESWMQNAADDLVERMMRLYNKKHTCIYNTIQCYRWDRLEYVKDLERKARKDNFKIGVKIVRGAYMEKENERAAEMHYKTPICESKKFTDRNFNEVLIYLMDRLDIFSVFVGSHNEPSTYLTLELMNQKKLSRNHHNIWFGQLFGMSDQITYNLSKQGYNVAKLLPFGPVKEVIPYLIRRAEENTSVSGQTGRELKLLNQELERRKK
ncbi:proline dehydrogenase family protein [Ascidiimonas sp. W6]|uniref:proline dehydrogenase family protein n=1 Tax=Ascidiimonas meishanensis TaxID=3128903 RepID=UPI0030EC09FC